MYFVVMVMHFVFLLCFVACRDLVDSLKYVFHVLHCSRFHTVGSGKIPGITSDAVRGK